MYCHKCGHELPDQGNFCPNCGTQRISEAQTRTNAYEEPGRNGDKITIRKKTIAAVLIAVIAAVLLFAFAGKGDGEEERVSAGKEPTTTTAAAEEEPEPTEYEAAATTAYIPEDGWYTEDGKQYYFQDGLMYVDIQEIDGEYYYFHEDGALAVNSSVDYDGLIFKTNGDGTIDRVVFEELGGAWSDEKYRFGNGGSSSILEMTIPVEDCTSMSFYLEANGEHGAKVNGTWKIYVRSNGKWKFLQEINYMEPSGSFDLEFDGTLSFDAITAHPTVQGNASYSSFFYLQDVDCPFRVLQNLL